MRKKLFAILLVGIFVLSLYACGSNSKTDLSGTWKTKEEDGSWMEAEIKDDVITINWISDEGESTSVFWVGSYDAPKDSGNEYSWESKRDKDKTDKEPLASSDDTKKFTYKDGKLTYQMTGFGVTTTMSMTREKQEIDNINLNHVVIVGNMVEIVLDQDMGNYHSFSDIPKMKH